MKKPNRPVIIAIFILISAFLERARFFNSSLFCEDEALHYNVFREIIEGDYFPRLGSKLSVLGAHNPGPFYSYWMSISQFFHHSPEAANLWIAFCASLGLVLLWDAYRHWIGETSALIATLLLCFSPWSVFYSERIWNPNLLHAFACLGFWFATKIRSSESRWLPGLGLVFAVIPQIHLSGAALLPAFAWMAWPGLRKATPKQWKWTGVVAFFLSLPYLTFELKSLFGNTRAILFNSAGEERSNHYLTFPLQAFRLLSLDTIYFEWRGYWQKLQESSQWSELFTLSSRRIAQLASYGVALTSIIFALRRRNLLLTPTLITLIGYWALLMISGKHVFPHYMQGAFVFLFWILGEALARSKRWVLAPLLIAWVGFAHFQNSWINQSFHEKFSLKQKRIVLAEIRQILAGVQNNVSLKLPEGIKLFPYQVLAEDLREPFTLSESPKENDSAAFELIDAGVTFQFRKTN